MNIAAREFAIENLAFSESTVSNSLAFLLNFFCQSRPEGGIAETNNKIKIGEATKKKSGKKKKPNNEKTIRSKRSCQQRNENSEQPTEKISPFNSRW